MRLGGQLRVASGMTVIVIGWDMNAALAMGDAMGVDRVAMAELLPDIEHVMAAKMNERASQNHDP